MSFWSGETLEIRLNEVIQPNDPSKIDSAAYRLSIGNEVFITSVKECLDSGTEGTKLQLSEKQPFKIPSGQFALLLTEEEVLIPNDTLGFISIRVKNKYKGLVNVSGFHVDPGWAGKLTFGVYNAGPGDIHLARGDDIFLIFFSELDQSTKKLYEGGSNKASSITNERVNSLSSKIYSSQQLSLEFQELKEQFNSLKNSLKNASWLASIIVAAIITYWITNIFDSSAEKKEESLVNIENNNKTPIVDAKKKNNEKDL